MQNMVLLLLVVTFPSQNCIKQNVNDFLYENLPKSVFHIMHFSCEFWVSANIFVTVLTFGNPNLRLSSFMTSIQIVIFNGSE